MKRRSFLGALLSLPAVFKSIPNYRWEKLQRTATEAENDERIAEMDHRTDAVRYYRLDSPMNYKNPQTVMRCRSNYERLYFGKWANE